MSFRVITGGKGKPKPLSDLFAQDMQSSGLTAEEGRKLGFKLRDTEEELYLSIYPSKTEADLPKLWTARGFSITYFDQYGEPVKNFCRARRLIGTFGKDLTQRYTQHASSLPHLWLPPRHASALPAPGKDGKIKPTWLLITEGEKKAAIANLCDLPCVALGGIWNFRSDTHRREILDELRYWFDLRDCEITFCYDADTFANKDIANAIYQAAHAIRIVTRPKTVNEIRLQVEVTGKKLALDDFLKSYGDRKSAGEALRQLPRLTDSLESYMAHINEVVVWDVEGKTYYDVTNGKPHRGETSLIAEHGPDLAVPDPGGNGRFVPAIKYWTSHRDTELTNVQRVEYVPGAERRFLASPGHHHKTLNLWSPNPLQPIAYLGKKADEKRLDLFFEYWRYFTQQMRGEDDNDYYANWFLSWLAAPIQKRPLKQLQAVIAISQQTGTGKTTIHEIMSHAHGLANSAKVGEREMFEDKFNERWIQKEWLYIDELSHKLGDRKTSMEHFKDLITGSSIAVRRMQTAAYSVPNWLNLYLTSNQQVPLPLDQHDRRFFVFEAPEERHPKGAAFWQALYQWLEGDSDPTSEDFCRGYREVYGYLLSVDLGDYRPNSHAPRTKKWHELVALTQTGGDPVLDDILSTLISSPVTVLGTKGTLQQVLWTPEALIKCVHQYAKDQGQPIRKALTRELLGKVLSRANIPKQTNLKVGDSWITAYAMADFKYWRKVKRKKWYEQLERDE